jgi:hypothetical protein
VSLDGQTPASAVGMRSSCGTSAPIDRSQRSSSRTSG